MATVLDRPSARSRRHDEKPSAAPVTLARPGIGPIRAWLIAGLLLWLLVGPRLDLPSGPGLRVEDLVLVALAVICATSIRRLSVPLDLTIAVAGVVVAGLISVAAAAARGLLDPVTGVLYAVRPVEYWIAFPAALLLFRAARGAWLTRIDRLLAIVTVLQTAFAVAQYYFGIPIGFSHAAYTRAAGLTVGPYELGAISAALVVYWIANGRWVMASLATVALASSISRISLVGAAIAVALLAVAWLIGKARLVHREGWRAAFRLRGSRWRAAAQLVSVAAAVLVLGFTLGIVKLPELPPPAAEPVASSPAAPAQDQPSDEPSDEAAPTPTPTPAESADAGPAIEIPSAPSENLANRFASTSILGSWFIAGEIAAAVPPVTTSEQYDAIAYSRLNEYVNAGNAASSGAEPSNLVRFFRWHLILDRFRSPVDVGLGLGPSFVGPSVDGSYLRFFADGGILGVVAWLALIVTWLRRGPLWMRGVTITMLVGGTFIDILYAQRPMVLFWLLLALAIVTVERTRRTKQAAVTASEAS